MLANYYFLTNNFRTAKPLYENILLQNNCSSTVKIKLSICYLFCGNIEKSLQLLKEQLQDKINVFNRTNIFLDDSQFRELIRRIEDYAVDFINKENKEIGLLILWFYKDYNKAIEILNKIEIPLTYQKIIYEIKKILKIHFPKEIINSIN